MELKSLYYVVNARMPTEKAHGLQVAKMCAAFAEQGVRVILILPRQKQDDSLYEAYRIPKTFEAEYIRALQLPLWIPYAFGANAFFFACAAAKRLRTERDAAVYTRGESILVLARLLPRSLPLIWETHIRPAHAARYRAAAQRASLLVSVTKHYAEEIPGLWDVSPERVCYASDAVTLEDFSRTESKTESRARLGLPLTARIALYIGRLDGWKGIDVLAKAAPLIPNTTVAMIGGEPAQIRELSQDYPEVRFLGYRPYTELPDNQAAADALVLTGNPDSEIARHYTSPLKLFTYMASGVPIVAFDLPAYRDILSDTDAFFCDPEPQALADMISYALEYPEEAQARSARALELVQEFSWNARARRILDRIRSAVPT
ncbi:MAG: hypothetical protein JWL88_416 [Parcubacteria group bacterium]|nr:hypothetical protein [Parcubacteria group bacterium]